MLSLSALLQFAAAAGLLMALVLVIVIRVAEPVLATQLARIAPARRVRVLAGLIAAPALAAAGFGAVILALPPLQDAPRLASACAGHSHALWHLCAWHPADQASSIGLWACLILAAALVGVLAGVGLNTTRRQQRSLQTVARLGHPYGGSVDLIDTPEPVALACGLGRGRILLSSALVKHLAPQHLKAVLAHERAHLAQRDLALRVSLLALSRLLFPATRRRLLHELDLALEQRCDQAAARSVGSPLVVAEAILAVERLRPTHPRQEWAMSFGSGFTCERVESLLSTPPDRRRWFGPMLAVTAVAICLLSVGWVHHATEFLLLTLP